MTNLRKSQAPSGCLASRRRPSSHRRATTRAASCRAVSRPPSGDRAHPCRSCAAFHVPLIIMPGLAGGELLVDLGKAVVHGGLGRPTLVDQVLPEGECLDGLRRVELVDRATVLQDPGQEQEGARLVVLGEQRGAIHAVRPCWSWPSPSWRTRPRSWAGFAGSSPAACRQIGVDPQDDGVASERDAVRLALPLGRVPGSGQELVGLTPLLDLRRQVGQALRRLRTSRCQGCRRS